jgi:hypothetical protein
MWPANISQIGYPGAGDIDDCWVVATVWAATASRPGIRQPTVTEFRRHAGDPDDGYRDGGSLTEIMDGCAGSWPGLDVLKFESTSWPIFSELVKSGRPASVALNSGALPPIHRYGFFGAHQCGLAWTGTGFVLANPLAPDGSPPKYITEAAIRHAMQQLVPGLDLLRAAVFPAPEEDMPGLTTTPGTNLLSGKARPKRGVEVIRVHDRERITLDQDVVREAVGPFVADDLKLPGYFISISGSTCWVRSTQANFTPDGLPTTVRTEVTLDGRKYVGNVTAV